MELRTRLSALLFHEPWWLSAASGGQYSEVTVERGGETIGRLPFVRRRKMGMRVLRMPHFTHVLGPAVATLKGKAETQLRHRIGIIRELLGQLPQADFFMHSCSSSLADTLAFQECGFDVKPQCNFQIDGRQTLASILDRMNFKTRGHIRRAEKDYDVVSVDTPEAFKSFYLANMEAAGRRDPMDFDTFPAVFAESRARDCGEILAACTHSGRPAAMVYLVWGAGAMYHLLATRQPGAASTNAANLLVWSAIKRAHERGLIFDFDGVVNSGQMRFFLGFGGEISWRLMVTRTRPIYGLARAVRMKLVRHGSSDTSHFT